MSYVKRLNSIRTEAIAYIILIVKLYKKIVIKGKCVLEYKDKQIMHSNLKTKWISLDISDKRYTTDYLCKIADDIYNQLKNN